MLSRDLAAFDIDNAPEPQAQIDGPELPTAIARAEGVLIGLADGSPLAEEFARFVNAVQKSAPGQQQQQYRAG